MPTPGVVRPMNLVDVLNSLSNQVGAIGSQVSNSGGSVTGIGLVAEADDIITPIGDTVIGSASTTPTWDNGGWNATVWS